MTPLTLPPCLLEGAKLLFPTLDFSRLRFYFDQYSVSDRTVAYLTRTEIIFNGSAPVWADDPCNKETFKLLCHELVHALQAQSLLRRIMHRAASWTCGFLHGQGRGATRNCIEHEAYAYEESLDKWLVDNGIRSPCVCNSGPTSIVSGEPMVNSAFVAAIAVDPTIVKRRAKICTPWHCIDDGFVGKVVGSFIGVAALVWGIATAFIEGTVGYIGAIVGGLVGAGGGAAAGSAVFGTIIGPLIGGVIGLIVGAIIGALIGNIVHWLDRLFGDNGSSLNLMFSQDSGLTFGSKICFERSTEPMSLSFGLKMVPKKRNLDGTPDWSAGAHNVDRLAVAFVGTDSRVNLLTFPFTSWWESKRVFERSEDCGPAVVHSGVRIHVAWQGTDNRLNTITTADGMTLAHHRVLPSKTPDDASPTMCVVGGKHILAYIDPALHIKLRVSNNGIDWKAAVPVNERAKADTSVAITTTRDNGFAIAWTGTDKQNSLNVMLFSLDQASSAITPRLKVTLAERSKAGPALAFFEGLLFLAWTGTDGRINFMRSRDLGRNFIDKQAFERSRKDCGPALAVHDETGSICIGWTGTD
jgi:hypothetical protein